MTTLDPHYRGSEFRYSFTLGNGWEGEMFTGGVKFTLRTAYPLSIVTDDNDAVEVASTETGEITFNGDAGTIVISAARTHMWPAQKLVWDLRGFITGPPARAFVIDAGHIVIRPNVGRSL